MSISETVKDSPIYAAAALTFLGVGLGDWVMIFGAAYGAVRLIMVLVEFYWKWKDRQDGRKRIKSRRVARDARLEAALEDQER